MKKNKLKILFCTNAFENVTNGPAKFANLLLKINDMYNDVEIRILTENVINETEKIYKLDLSYPKPLKLLSHFFRMYQYHQKAMQIKKEYNWDIIVYNNAFIGLWSAYKIKPSVGMINDYTLANSKFQFKYYSIRNRILKFFEKISIHHHDLILTNSNNLKNQLLNIYSLKKEKHKFKVLYKGVLINTQKRKPTFVSPYKMLFVKKNYFLGGLKHLLEAIRLLKYNVSLNIIGPKKNELTPELITLIEKSNHNINVLGALSQEVVYNLMKKTDIFCVPSIEEALGVANIEAMNFGCSIVTTNVGGIPEVMDNGNNGWMVPPKSPEALAQAITECIENPQLRDRKRNNAYRYIKKFNINNTIHNFVKIIKDHLNETTHPKP